MQRRDGRLQRERTGPAAERLLDERQRLGDLVSIPPPAILLFEHDEITGLVQTSVAARIVKQHEGDERRGFPRRRRHQRPHQTAQTDGLGAEVGSHERRASSSRIPFVEDEIDHRQHRVEPRGHVAGVGHGIRDSRVANLTLCPHDPLRHRRWRDQKRACDLVGLEAAERAKRQRDLRLGGKRGVTAGEDQPETIVGDLGRIVVGLLDGLVEPRRSVRVERFFRPRPAPDAVDRLVAGGLNDPGAWKLRDAGGPPLIHGGRKRFLRRLFSQVEVADEADQRGHDPAPIGAIHGIDRRGGSVVSGSRAFQASGPVGVMGHVRW